MLQEIWSNLIGFSWIEWLGLVTGIIYIYLSANNKISCWYFGIISCACIAYHDFFSPLKLYSDGVLQIIYIIMGIAGLLRWKNKSVEIDAVGKGSSVRVHLIAIVIGILLSIAYGKLMATFTDAALPTVDAYTTIFSIIATLFLVNRMISAWVYFIVIDIIMTYIYYDRGFPLYSALFLIYTVFAVYALWKWPKEAKSVQVV